MKYKICSFITLFFFMFNVHASISHDVEHEYHAGNKLEHNISDCLSKYNFNKLHNYDKSPCISLLSLNEYFEKVIATIFLPINFSYYNSRAP